MFTLMQAVDEQFLKYPVERMSKRQNDDLHLAAKLVTPIKLREDRAEKVLKQVQKVFPEARLR